MEEVPAATRRLAALSLALVALTVVAAVGFASAGGLWLLLLAVVCVVAEAAAAYWFLSRRGLGRWVSLILLAAIPILLAAFMIWADLVLDVIVVAGLALGSFVAGRAALRLDEAHDTMPEYDAPRPQRPFLLMNPRSGGGKVTRFGLVAKAEALGAEVVTLDGPGVVDVEALARTAVAAGADMLGVAGGDGTQALVAKVAAEHDLPFLVISAGTRNHFALDLGLDRDDPTGCLDALGHDAVELHVDLGDVAGRTFVNNVSFGAYAAVVQSPAYRDDKTRTTLEILPDLLTGHAGPHLVGRADALTVEGPHALLVSNNPYGLGDIAGMGRRARLDGGVLGVVAVTVEDVREAVGLLRHVRSRGVTVAQSRRLTVSADTPHVSAGIDGEFVQLPTPVVLSVRPGALRVRVPRHRPGIPRRTPPWSWVRLRQLATARWSARR